ncbi:MAG: zf-HC2 domain-containing protein [Actinomycetota bacterium]|nr:zf-HC2 domain-containing protein [Actinomycetota bacterium]
MTEPTCEEFNDLAAELALGILDGRDRAEAIAHLERCPNCHQELLLMGDLADRIVALTPSAEPPAGFETRVLAALAPQATRTKPYARRPGGMILATAAAAVAAVAIGVGGWAIGHTTNQTANHSGVVTAAFVSNGERVGQLVESDSSPPWVYMTVDTGIGDKSVICELRQSDGRIIRLGSFQLKDGYGEWGAPLPTTAKHVTGATLVNSHGLTVATATFT